MKGVVLAGGHGTRLRPLTRVINKHLLPVFDRAMIEYPIQTLKDMGCDNIIIVSGGDHIGSIAEYLGGQYTYRVQEEAGGIAQALGCAKGLVDGVFPVILGDNYFSEPPVMPARPTIFVKDIEDPERFGVYDGKKIIEKPTKYVGNSAVVGLYVYDERVFDFIDTLKPSKRGEYEITDVNNLYLEAGAKVEQYIGYWSDLGTFTSLRQTSNLIAERVN